MEIMKVRKLSLLLLLGSIGLVLVFTVLPFMTACSTTTTVPPTTVTKTATHAVPIAATEVVAASNTIAQEQAQADYVCSGTTDGQTIESAIKAVEAPSQWNSNGQILSAGTFATVVKASASYFMYYNTEPTEEICRAISSDGINWTPDTTNNPVFAPSGAVTAIAVPCVWIESGTWYMIYRYVVSGVEDIGLATSANGISWTTSGSNPILTKTGNESTPFDPHAVMKVGTTYYLYYNTSGLHNNDIRYINYATSTNLTTWTKSSTPIIGNGSFCPTVFTDGTLYYMITTSYVSGQGGAPSTFQLYSSTTPTFAVMTFLGVVHTDSVSGFDSYDLDCPFILTSDITRTISQSSPLLCYFSGESSGLVWTTGLLSVSTLSNAIAQAEMRGSIKLLPGTYNIGENNVFIDSPISFKFEGCTLFSPSHTRGGTIVVCGTPGVQFVGGTIEYGTGTGNCIMWGSSNGLISCTSINGYTYINNNDSNLNITQIGGYVLFEDALRNHGVIIANSATNGVDFKYGSANNDITLYANNCATGVKCDNYATNNIVHDGSINVVSTLVNADNTTSGNMIINNFINGSGATTITDLGTNNNLANNQGYIDPGEIRTISDSITGVSAGTLTSIDNPFGQSVTVIKVDLEITTQSVASGTLSVGIGSTNNTEYITMFNALPTDVGTSYPDFDTSTISPGTQTIPINWTSGEGNRYLNFYNKTENTNFVATYTITVMGN